MKFTATQLRKIIMEEVSLAKTSGKDPQRFLHGYESGHPTDDEGYMVKSRMAAVKEMAETICDLLEMEDQLPGWVQDLVAGAHRDMEHVKDYLVGDEKLRNYSKEKPPVGMPTEAYIGGASKRMMGGRPEAEMAAGRLQTPATVKMDNLKRDIAFQKAQIKKAKSGKLKGQDIPAMEALLVDLQSQLEALKTESVVRSAGRLLEGHSRITEEEFAAWKSGDWGFVSEHDGGGPRRRSMDVIPADPDKLTAYIIRNYEGACADLGCEDVSDPEFKEYVTDQLAGKVDPMTLKMALAGL